MAKVYVPNRGPHDYTAAEEFGELVFCSDGPLDKNDTSQMYRLLSQAMQDSEPGDYILLTSLASLCCIAAALMAYKHSRVNLLIYQDDHYVVKSLHFD